MIIPKLDTGAEIYQGAEFDRTYQYLVDGTPQDITDATIIAKYRTAIDSQTVVISREVGDGITIVDAEDGTFKVTMTDAETAAINYPEKKVLFFDIFVTLDGGSPAKVAYGVANFFQSVSR